MYPLPSGWDDTLNGLLDRSRLPGREERDEQKPTQTRHCQAWRWSRKLLRELRSDDIYDTNWLESQALANEPCAGTHKRYSGCPVVPAFSKTHRRIPTIIEMTHKHLAAVIHTLSYSRKKPGVLDIFVPVDSLIEGGPYSDSSSNYSGFFFNFVSNQTFLYFRKHAVGVPPKRGARTHRTRSVLLGLIELFVSPTLNINFYRKKKKSRF